MYERDNRFRGRVFSDLRCGPYDQGDAQVNAQRWPILSWFGNGLGTTGLGVDSLECKWLMFDLQIGTLKSKENGLSSWRRPFELESREANVPTWDCNITVF